MKRLPLLLWAVRDARRRPGAALLTSLGLGVLVTFVSALVLTEGALESTTRKVLESSPSLVVRRVSPGGWAPMPATAVEKVRGITGITDTSLRVFGTVTGPNGPLTLHGVSPENPLNPIRDGEARLGPGVPAAAGALTVVGSTSRRLTVVGRWPDETAMVTQDIVETTQRTAREILGLPKGHGSDLAVWVFRDEEAAAIIPELQRALDFPVQTITRDDARGRDAAFFARRAGLSLLLFVPALIGLALLVAATVRERLSVKGELALLKAVGWTTADVAAVHLFRGMVIGLPGVILGLAVGFTSVAVPGVTWPLELFFEWDGSPPGLILSLEDVAGALAVIGGSVIAPWLVAAALPVWSRSTADPADLLRGG